MNKLFLRLLLRLSFLLVFPGAICCTGKDEETVPVKGVELATHSCTLLIGRTIQLHAEILPGDATDRQLSWASSNTGVASVDAEGVVTALAEGAATITVTTHDGGFSAKCSITVTAIVQGSRKGVVTAANYGGSGSGGDDVRPGGGGKNGYNYVFGGNTIQVTKEILDNIEGLASTGFSLPGDTEGNSSIGTGDVIVFPICNPFPGGYAGKIEKVTTEDDGKTYRYDMSVAALDEVFEELDLKQTDIDLDPLIERVEDESGRMVPYTVAGNGVEISIEDLFPSLSFDLSEHSKLELAARIWLNLDLDASIKGFSLKHAEVRIDAEAIMNAKIGLVKEVKATWKSPRMKMILAAIPVGPIIITPEVYVQLELDLKGEVSINATLSFRKAFYATAVYDGEFNCDGHWVETGNDGERPFSASGEIGGSIEFGPNIGLSVSVYGGALGLSVDLDIHAELELSNETASLTDLLNKTNAGEWLSSTSLTFKIPIRFGGSFDLAWRCHFDFKLPDSMSLAFTLWNRTLIPTLDADSFAIKTFRDRASAEISATIENRSIFQDLYLKIYKGHEAEGESFEVVRFNQPVFPEREETASCKAVFNNMIPGQEYYVDGPYVTVSGAEVGMYPWPGDVNRIIRYGDLSPYKIPFWAWWNGDKQVIEDELITNREAFGVSILEVEVDEKLFPDEDIYSGTIYFDSPVKAIGERAFFHSGEEESGTYPFLEWIELPETVESIGAEAFAGSSYGSTIIIPESVKEVGDYAFGGVWNIEGGSGLIKVGNGAFQDDRIYEIPESLIEIGDRAFAETPIRELSLSSSVTLGQAAFWGCYLLEKVYVNTRVIPYMAFYGTACMDLEIGEDVEIISDYAFDGVRDMKGISLAHVKEIGSHAFYGCCPDYLDMGDKLEKIGEESFYSYEFGNGKLDFPKTVRDMGTWDFYRGFNNVDDIYLYPAVAPEGFLGFLYSVSDARHTKPIRIHVPKEQFENYESLVKRCEEWSFDDVSGYYQTRHIVGWGENGRDQLEITAYIIPDL